MDFDLTDEQREIKNVARELLSARSPLAKVREAAEAAAYDPGLWRRSSRSAGPGSRSPSGTAARVSAPSSSRSCSRSSGTRAPRRRFFDRGRGRGDPGGRGTISSASAGSPGWLAGELTAGVGAADLAADAEGAAVVVLLDGDEARLVAEPQTEPLVTIDPTRRFARVDGDGEPLQAAAAPRVFGAIAAELVGVCQRALEMTLEYVKERKQFGVPVGSFQAVSHRCAQMLLYTESARSTAYYAAWAADADPSRLGRGVGAGGCRRRDRGSRGHRERDPGPRRDRLHLGGRRPLALQARPARRGAARWCRAPSRCARARSGVAGGRTGRLSRAAEVKTRPRRHACIDRDAGWRGEPARTDRE